MPTKYWIKLYHEILHDQKMARMDDTLWRRTIELFLLAGEEFKGGLLPSLDSMAWTLRVNPEQLESELVELQKVGIISIIDGSYFVTKFSERQQPMPKAEYMQRKRNEKQLQEYYQPVTNSNADIDIDKDIDKIAEAGKENGADPFKKMQVLVETLMGLPTLQSDIPTILDFLNKNVIEDDIRGALQWRKDNKLPPVKTISRLAGGVMTERSRRIQDANSKSNFAVPHPSTYASEEY